MSIRVILILINLLSGVTSCIHSSSSMKYFYTQTKIMNSIVLISLPSGGSTSIKKGWWQVVGCGHTLPRLSGIPLYVCFSHRESNESLTRSPTNNTNTKAVT
ncbi:unnamed protein product [Brassica oleracea]